MDTGEHSERDERLAQISRLLVDYRHVLNSLSADTIQRLCNVCEILKKVERVFIAGNGGSAATAIHFASDLCVVGVKAFSLCENMSVITRIANDEGYAKIFLRQLMDLDLTKRDALVLITVSGKSTNIMEAAVWAKYVGAVVIGLMGFDGGYLKKITDYDITLGSSDYGIVEGLHSYLCHIIPEVLKEIHE